MEEDQNTLLLGKMSCYNLGHTLPRYAIYYLTACQESLRGFLELLIFGYIGEVHWANAEHGLSAEQFHSRLSKGKVRKGTEITLSAYDSSSQVVHKVKVGSLIGQQ